MADGVEQGGEVGVWRRRRAGMVKRTMKKRVVESLDRREKVIGFFGLVIEGAIWDCFSRVGVGL